MLPLTQAMMSISAIASNTIFSPKSRASCVRKVVAPSRFRYEPYGARVLPSPASPLKFTPYPPAPSSSRLDSSARSVEASTTSSAFEPVAPLARKVAKPPSPRYAVVKFKHESFTFLAPFKIFPGDIVVVEGDRGENIGEVAEITKDAPTFTVAAKVIRVATDKDLAALTVQREREMAATLSTRALAESLGLHGRVEDAEYQFDMNKLTIFVRRPTKSTFVDFRKLQRTLFREFRCRIWCSYMDEVEAAEEGPRVR